MPADSKFQINAHLESRFLDLEPIESILHIRSKITRMNSRKLQNAFYQKQWLIGYLTHVEEGLALEGRRLQLLFWNRLVFNERMRILIKASMLLALILVGRQGLAQHYFEVRASDTKYRYFDWNYTFSSSAIVDMFYVGVPGSNEFNLGGGYGFKPKPSLMIAPMAYAVIGKEAGQRGIKLALLATFEKNGWKVNSFIGHFERIDGDFGRYQVLDTFDASRMMHKQLEAGISAGFFHAGGEWKPQIGPLLKWNDRFGAWYVSYRFGSENELRFSRNFLIK
jgi:hypothetical protein